MSPVLGKFRNLHPGVGIEVVIGVGGETLLYSRISPQIKGLYLINIKSFSFTTVDILLYEKL